jgi:HSP20 family protein
MTRWNSNLPSRKENNLFRPDFDRSFDLSEMFNRFLSDFSSDLSPGDQNDNFMPKIEVEETDKQYLVSAELPGLKEEEIDLTLRDNVLIIEGEKKSEKKEEKKGIYKTEFSYGSFYRAIPFRSEVEDKSVDASYQDGILKVALAKKNEGKESSRKIQIKSSSAKSNEGQGKHTKQ